MDKKISIYSLSITKNDSIGSSRSQVSYLTSRVSRITSHLERHPKDFSSQRGLWKLLGKRKRILRYLFRKDLNLYNRVIKNLGIRGLKEI
uniref:Small ribosomal subunit protein uS15c n=1 Tax=Lygodium japonicum TaxID=13824 RepID=S4UBB8_LYGJA|nr:ribosomal protein S15 [Lygodium japonicum]AGI51443.1 ribosomal protein S15 [Lygodium japonicum]AHA59663.1 ribosomal protein S15 [Lygodium japonicum]